MARPFEKIIDINDLKEPWKVSVCVHHKWSMVTNNKEHLEMIVVDKDGTDVHVIVPTTYLSAFNTMLNVDHTYTISNFKVAANDLVFKPSCHQYMVKFTGGTSVSDVDKHVIPPKITHFTSFDNIMTGRFKKDVLIAYNVSLCTISKVSMVNVSGQLSLHSRVYFQNNENSQQYPFHKLLSKAIVLPLNDIIKLREACHECPKVARDDKPSFMCESGHSTEA
ncbi:hypothetical protein KIW84_011726 [Lathyrus oleraceus]|uniref:Replication protein A 70 kDa DNA-binding subunit B/D first OB fold domain-containing protein n=1 Tax=Pisum sativum TaxID=3888 RepID=A0A9D5BFQ0_PEA|nr:hypothetical protein KIW84_011726 [Pisum sativum]